MARIRYTTTIREELLKKARMCAAEKNLNTNDILEKALEYYFTNKFNEVWEKELSSGCIERLVISSEKVIAENIRNRLERFQFNPKDYLPENLTLKGWIKV